MSVTPFSTVVGAFRSQSASEQAMETLYRAGFQREQVYCLIPVNSVSFFDGLKSFFSGEPAGTGNYQGDPTNDFVALGLSDKAAHYYAVEFGKGNTVLVVNTSGHEQKALSILHQCGAYDAEMKPPDEISSETPRNDYMASDLPRNVQRGSASNSGRTSRD